ncbi:MAG: hypothetical protein R2838_14300 [Caldilineaceae bacterium]
MAETYLLPVTSHDCIGPVALWSAAHLMLHPNAMVMVKCVPTTTAGTTR